MRTWIGAARPRYRGHDQPPEACVTHTAPATNLPKPLSQTWRPSTGSGGLRLSLWDAQGEGFSLIDIRDPVEDIERGSEQD
jgi:hypothetical protein